jgi:hypothetical protein
MALLDFELVVASMFVIFVSLLLLLVLFFLAAMSIV